MTANCPNNDDRNYALFCSNDYVPTVHGPFNNQHEAVNDGFEHRGTGIFIVRRCADLADATEQANFFAEFCRCEDAGHAEGCSCPENMPLITDNEEESEVAND